MLGGVAVAHHRLLYLHRLIGKHFQPRLPDGKEYHAPALGNADAGGDILAEKQLFNGHAIGLGHFQKLAHIFIDDFQPGGKIHPCRGGDGAAAHQTAIAPVRFHNAEAGDAVAGVDAQNPHQVPPPNRPK